MRFWDSSAIVSLLVDERARADLLALLKADSGLVVWWGTPVDCASAIARRAREGALAATAANAALARLHAFEPSWVEVLPTIKLRRLVLRLLRAHTLRAADSLQLAAALIAAEQDPGVMGFVCLDERLAAAAEREGFSVAP